MYEEIHAWHTDELLARVAAGLAARGFETAVKRTAAEIVDHVAALVTPGASVGVGGSVTVRSLGLPGMLARRGHVVHDHWREGLSKDEVYETRRKQLTSDFFLTSANAITLDGRLVNIDGAGNRVAAMSFGPRHVIVIAGANKIARDLDAALWRVRHIASPQNCKRLAMKTPCAATGRCHECGVKCAVCKITTIIDSKPMAMDYTVILTPLALGF
ncbi:MAG: lactate utilization protein [Bacteroidota bacterium]